MISIVMPCFNAEAYIESSVNSVMAQSFRDFELIIVDDKSTDHSIKIVKRLREKDPRIKIISLEKNMGPGMARNIGIESTTFQLVALMDADDIWNEKKLEVQFAVHQKTNCAFSCTGFQFGKSTVTQKTVSYQSLLKHNVVNTSSVMFDTDKLDIRFKSEFKSEDYIAWLDVAKKVKIEFVNQVLVCRTVFDGISSNKLEMAKKRWEIYRQVERLNFIQSAYYFSCYFITGLAKYAKL